MSDIGPPWDIQLLASRSPVGRAAFNNARSLAYFLGDQSEVLTISDVESWHRAIFEPLGCTPTERIGCLRGGLDLRASVHSGDPACPVWITSLPDLVDSHTEELLAEVMVRVDLFDPEHMKDQLHVLSAYAYSSWLKIHPFNDGNGRTGVCLVDWLCGRLKIRPFMMRGNSSAFVGEQAEQAVAAACQPSSRRERKGLEKIFMDEIRISLE